MAPPETKAPLPGRDAAPTSNGSSSGSYDAIVVGGGHNGLTTAAYLAKAGQRVLVLERRPILGGACVTEELWPGRRVSRASSVVSMLQPRIVKDLRLEAFRSPAPPLGPGTRAPRPVPPRPRYGRRPRGPPVSFRHSTAAAADSTRPLSSHDADNFVAFEE